MPSGQNNTGSLIRFNSMAGWIGGNIPRRRGGASAFSPSDVPGLSAWYDGSLAATMFTTSAGSTNVSANGDRVGRWEDRSGNARNALQATADNRGTYVTGALNGLSVVRFDGVSDFLQTAAFTAIPQPTTIFIVCKYTNQVAQFMCDGIVDGPERQFIMVNNAGNNMVRIGTDGAFFEPFATIYDTYQLIAAEYNVASSQAWQNGGTAQAGTVANEPLSGITLAARLSGTFIGNCDIAEYLLYSAELSAANFTAVRNYLNAKWVLF